MMNIEEAVNFLVEHATKVDAELRAIRAEMATKVDLTGIRAEMATKTDLTSIRAEMAPKTATDFLVEHAAIVDAELAKMATKDEVADLRDDVRTGTQAMRNYVAYVESMLNAVTKGQFGLEDQAKLFRIDIDDLKRRIRDLEQGNQAA